jgi:hypothetical protein
LQLKEDLCVLDTISHHCAVLFLRSDYDAWANLVQPQSYADNYTQAAAMGINAGMDQEVSPCAFETFVTRQSPVGDSFGRTAKLWCVVLA